MAETTLKRGAITALTIQQAITNGQAFSSNAFGLGSDEGSAPEDYRIVVSATAGSPMANGDNVDIYIAEGNAAGSYDGGVGVSQAVDINALPKSPTLVRYWRWNADDHPVTRHRQYHGCQCGGDHCQQLRHRYHGSDGKLPAADE